MSTIDDEMLSILEIVDKLMWDQDIVMLDEKLKNIIIEETDTNILLTWLTATLPVKSKLPSRSKFFKDTKKVTINRNQFESGTLAGLE